MKQFRTLKSGLHTCICFRNAAHQIFVTTPSDLRKSSDKHRIYTQHIPTLKGLHSKGVTGEHDSN